MKNIVIDFDKMGTDGDAALLDLSKVFERAGITVIGRKTDTKIKREQLSAITYRTGEIEFADSQRLSISVKRTGDIFAVKLNDKALPIKNQDDQDKAIAEIIAKLDSGRAKYQDMLRKRKVALPDTIKTAIPKQEEVLKEEVATLKELITVAEANKNTLVEQIAKIDKEISAELTRAEELAKQG